MEADELTPVMGRNPFEEILEEVKGTRADVADIREMCVRTTDRLQQLEGRVTFLENTRVMIPTGIALLGLLAAILALAKVS